VRGPVAHQVSETSLICSVWAAEVAANANKKDRLNLSDRLLRSHLRISIMARNLRLRLIDTEYAISAMV